MAISFIRPLRGLLGIGVLALLTSSCVVYPDGTAVELPPGPPPVIVSTPVYGYGGYAGWYRPYYYSGYYRGYGYHRPYRGRYYYQGGYRGNYYYRGGHYGGGYYRGYRH